MVAHLITPLAVSPSNTVWLVIGISVAVVIILSIVGSILWRIDKKKWTVPHAYVGFDAFRKSYDEAKTEQFFFAHISDEDVGKILSHIKVVEEWIKEKEEGCKTERDRKRLSLKYAERKTNAFL